jgi:hypothetical protein
MDHCPVIGRRWSACAFSSTGKSIAPAPGDYKVRIYPHIAARSFRHVAAFSVGRPPPGSRRRHCTTASGSAGSHKCGCSNDGKAGDHEFGQDAPDPLSRSVLETIPTQIERPCVGSSRTCSRRAGDVGTGMSMLCWTVAGWLSGDAPARSLHGVPRSAQCRSCTSFPAPVRWPQHFAHSSIAPTAWPSALP